MEIQTLLKRYLFFVLTICLLGIDGFAIPQNELDSLKHVHCNNVVSDSMAFRIEWKLAFNMTYADPDSGLLWSKTFYKHAQQKRDTSKILRVLHLLNVNFINLLEYDSALLTANKKYELADIMNDKKHLIDAWIDIGNVKREVGLLDSALIYYQTALDSALKLDNTRLIQRSLINLGEVSTQQGLYALAHEYYSKAEKRKLRGFFASVHKDYGDLYSLQEDYEKANFHYAKSIRYSRKSGRDNSLIRVFQAKGEMYEKMEQIDSSSFYYKSAIDLSLKINHKRNFAISLIHLGRVYRLRDVLDSSESSLKAAIEIMENRSMLNELPIAYKELGITYLQMNNIEKAKFNFLLSYELLKSTRDIALSQGILGYLVQIGELEANNEQQIHYLQELRIVEAQIFNKEQTRALAISQTERDFDLIRAEDGVLAQSKEIEYEQNLKSEQTKRNLATLVGFIVLIFAVLLGYGFRANRKKNKLLERQKLELEKTGAEKELLLKEIHHRVKNNLQVISSLLDLQTIRSSDENTTKQLLEGQSRVKSMALIHQKLYQQDQLGTVDFEDYLKSMASFIKSTFLIKGSSQININAKGCSLDIDRAIPLGLIINELLTNAFKYAQVDGQELKVDISIFTRKEEFIIKVSDNGLGINSENDMNEAKSLGMRLIKRLTKQLKGNISYKYDQGAKFELHFLQEA